MLIVGYVNRVLVVGKPHDYDLPIGKIYNLTSDQFFRLCQLENWVRMSEIIPWVKKVITSDFVEIHDVRIEFKDIFINFHYYTESELLRYFTVDDLKMECSLLEKLLFDVETLNVAVNEFKALSSMYNEWSAQNALCMDDGK